MSLTLLHHCCFVLHFACCFAFFLANCEQEQKLKEEKESIKQYNSDLTTRRKKILHSCFLDLSTTHELWISRIGIVVANIS